jgi:CubicO group peptidase (beta-lactamase class C family)
MAKKIINIPIVIACLLCFTYTACSDYAIAQDVSKRIDSLFNAVAQKTHFNGSVVVAENGKIIYENPGGYANIDKKVPNSSATNFSLASLSKVFTAVAVMQLKEKGKLNLDDPLIKYLPDFPFANITIKQLLSHTSGLPDFEIFQSYTRASHDKPLCEKDIIPALKKGAELIAAPGTKWRYSNVGFGLLALLVENVSHQSFRQYIQENICKPAGLKNTYVDVPGTNFHDEARATPYVSSFSSDITSGDTLKTDLSDPIQTIAGTRIDSKFCR